MMTQVWTPWYTEDKDGKFWITTHIPWDDFSTKVAWPFDTYEDMDKEYQRRALSK